MVWRGLCAGGVGATHPTGALGHKRRGGALGYAGPPARIRASELQCCVKKEQVRQGWCGVCRVSRVLDGAACTSESSGQDSSAPPWHRASETGTHCSSDIAALPLLHPRAQTRIATSMHLLGPPFCCGTGVYKRTSPRLAAASHPAASPPLSTPEGLNLGTVGSLFPLPLL